LNAAGIALPTFTLSLLQQEIIDWLCAEKEKEVEKEKEKEREKEGERKVVMNVRKKS